MNSIILFKMFCLLFAFCHQPFLFSDNKHYILRRSIPAECFSMSSQPSGNSPPRWRIIKNTQNGKLLTFTIV